MGMHRVLQDAPLETKELHKMTDIFQYDAFTMSITLVCPCVQHVSICVLLHAVLPNQKVQATKTGYRLFHELLNVWHYIELYAEEQTQSIRDDTAHGKYTTTALQQVCIAEVFRT
jgi:hypothetical protein